MLRHCVGPSILAFAIVVTLSACTSDVEERPVLYWPELDADVWSNVSSFGEPMLYRDGALSGFKSRYRLTTDGIRCVRYSIRLDESEDGIVKGSFKSRDDCPRDADGEKSRSSFSATSEELRELDRLADKAGMFDEAVQIWPFPKDTNTICVDGVQLMFERLDANGYRVAIANYPCSATEEVLGVANKFVEIAEAEQEGVF
jgi:hypothetical protein